MADMDFEGWSLGTIERSGLGLGVYGPRFNRVYRSGQFIRDKTCPGLLVVEVHTGLSHNAPVYFLSSVHCVRVCGYVCF